MPKPIRIIARLDVKGSNVVKGVHLEGLRIVGTPADMARQYYEDGADEMIYMDIVASLYQRNNLLEIVDKAAQEMFVPLTVGGGVRSLDDIERLLRVGADKVAINTAAIARPSFVREAAQRFGSQCIVVSIEAKKAGPGAYVCFTDNGRQKTPREVSSWVDEVVSLGCGEILLTSIDREGTQKGFDTELVSLVSRRCPVPVVASGGAGKVEDVISIFRDGDADAVALAALLHYKKSTIREVRAELEKHRFGVRAA